MDVQQLLLALLRNQQPTIHPLIQIQQLHLQNTINALTTVQLQRAQKRPRTPPPPPKEEKRSYRIDDLLNSSDSKTPGPLTSTPKKGTKVVQKWPKITKTFSKTGRIDIK